jgi:hypothetical protein
VSPQAALAHLEEMQAENEALQAQLAACPTQKELDDVKEENKKLKSDNEELRLKASPTPRPPSQLLCGSEKSARTGGSPGPILAPASACWGSGGGGGCIVGAK